MGQAVTKEPVEIFKEGVSTTCGVYEKTLSQQFIETCKRL